MNKPIGFDFEPPEYERHGKLLNFLSTGTLAEPIILFANEKPQSKQSVRFGKGKTYTDPKKAAYQAKLVAELKFCYSGPIITGPVFLDVLFSFQLPKKNNGPCLRTKTPDLGNLEKAFLDALEEAEILENDKQISKLSMSKIESDSSFIYAHLYKLTPDQLAVINKKILE